MFVPFKNLFEEETLKSRFKLRLNYLHVIHIINEVNDSCASDLFIFFGIMLNNFFSLNI